MKKSSAPNEDEAVQRILKTGIRGASPVDLLTITLHRDGTQAEVIEETARALIKRFGIHLLGDLGRAELAELAGCSEDEALRLLAALELGRRSGMSGKGELKCVTKPQDVAELFSYLKNEAKEHFCVALLNSKKKVIAVRTIHIGTVNASVVGISEVFREAVKEGAVSLIAVHNHPSGDPSPSPEDQLMTLQLASAGNVLNVPLDDHVIIGHTGYFSFRQQNLI